MPALTLKLDSLCGGGNHAAIRVAINGVDKGTVNVWLADVLSPASDEDKETFVTTLLRLAAIDHTPQQIRNGLENVNGYTITL